MSSAPPVALRATTRSDSVRSGFLVAGLSIYAVATLISMATMSVGIAFAVLGILIALGPTGYLEALRSEWKHERFRKTFWFSVALTAACALSLLAAIFHPLGFDGHAVQVSFGRDMAKAWYLFWPLLLLPGLRALSPAGKANTLRSWLIAFGVLSVIGIQQYFTGWPRPQPIPGNAPYFHATLFLGHHLSVASILIFPFFAALDFLASKKPILPKAVLGAMVAAGLVTLFFTYSRNLWAALPVGIGLWLIWTLPRRVRVPVVIAFVVGGLALTQLPAVNSRLHSGMGISDRVELWKANLVFLRDRPLTGVGWHKNLDLSAWYLESKEPGISHFVGHAHDNAIEMLGSTGILGFAAWLAWSLWALALAWSVSRKKGGIRFGRALVCAWIVFQLNGLTQVNFWESKVMHQMMWVLAWSLLFATEGSSDRGRIA